MKTPVQANKRCGFTKISVDDSGDEIETEYTEIPGWITPEVRERLKRERAEKGQGTSDNSFVEPDI